MSQQSLEFPRISQLESEQLLLLDIQADHLRILKESGVLWRAIEALSDVNTDLEQQWEQSNPGRDKASPLSVLSPEYVGGQSLDHVTLCMEPANPFYAPEAVPAIRFSQVRLLPTDDYVKPFRTITMVRADADGQLHPRYPFDENDVAVAESLLEGIRTGAALGILPNISTSLDRIIDPARPRTKNPFK